MDPFPDDWEFLWVFECDPEESDEVYTRFDAEVDENRILFEVWPHDTEVILRWWRGKEAAGNLELRWVKGISAETEKGVSALNVTFLEECLLPLRFQVRPYPSIAWGTKWRSVCSVTPVPSVVNPQLPRP
ncbi:hypothetical protein KOR34_43870 [Posidoniimonas corsicana]|uniref:Uncharacterized protein n=1 Tax=Posidoniimonas corsicana TaxID=1938618 RepID=A0A5C5UZC1_9BACT|nr:hypothetical protein [Posidoniimonas corsicana]TWT31013.1 hypothetical protein KOR34_43870 [Posidoniimonas corsicana]